MNRPFRMMPAMVRRLLVVAVVMSAAAAGNGRIAAQTASPIARYPLVSDLNDSTGQNAPVQARNAPFLQGKGLFCNGLYISEVPDACDVRTPSLNAWDLSAFTISARFYVPRGPFLGGPVFVAGHAWRWVSYELESEGRVALAVNSKRGDECSVRYRPGYWHEAAITFDGRITTLYLDGIAGCTTYAPLNTGNEKFISLTNFGNATTFHGLIRDLTVYNAVVPPARREPEADDVAFPPPADLTGADRLLGGCPTPQQMASVDADLQLSFEVDPTAREPLACTAAGGSRDLSPMKKRVYNSLLLMRRLEFDQPLPWTTDPLYRWLIHAIRGVRFRGDIENSSCCTPANVVNIAAQHLIINYTDRWVDPAIHGGGLAAFVLVLVHEARHAEGHPHTCGTKDQTVEELGAWGVQYHLTRWLAEHTDQSFFSAGSLHSSEVLLRQANLLRRAQFCRP